jgi:hypothetical protein
MFERMQVVAVFNATDRPREVSWIQLGLRQSDSWRFIAGRDHPREMIPVEARGFVLLVRK